MLVTTLTKELFPLSSPLKFAVIGDPIVQNFAPQIHSPVLSHYVGDVSYEKVRVPRGALPQWLERVRKENYAGFTVAMPHKMEIGQYLDELVMEADLVGSVNTVINRKGKLIGYSTDALGFFTALREKGIDFDEKRIVILGAGGAASALAYRAILDNAGRVEILSRRSSQARNVAQAIRGHLRDAPLSWDTMTRDKLHEKAAKADIIINATPQGMAGVDAVWPDLSFLSALPEHAVVCDIIHAPKRTAFLEEAKRLGHVTQNGVNMLIYQSLVTDSLYLDRPVDYAKMAKMVKETLAQEGGAPVGVSPFSQTDI